ncbi:MAG: hypothetical protein JW737_04175 [Acidobacteria bacterium]|nr:hypothetical protein [Acidobacteriota bacterium]
MENREFRPIASLLRIRPLKPSDKTPLDIESMDKLKSFIEDDIEFLDVDQKPLIDFLGEISLPVKAPAHISIGVRTDSPEGFIEVGFTLQQVLSYLSYLDSLYTIIGQENSIVIPFSGKEGKAKEFPGITSARDISVQDILYFEEWGVHPEEFLLDNHKLESVIRYCRFAPDLKEAHPLRFIMNEEELHLMLDLTESEKPGSMDFISAGITLYNFYKTADMLQLKGEWKLFREMDRPDREKYKIPSGPVFIGTWHGQLF